MDLTDFKNAQQVVWSTGDYQPVGTLLNDAAHRLVRAANIAHGDRVLDVGTGSGSVAIAAAQAGAEVLGIDITDACFAAATQRARDVGVSIELRRGDAESLEVGDATFDVVLSSFAAIFAPRHQVVAAELTRACRAGGTVAFTAWTPGGTNARTFAPLIERLPPPPSFAMPSINWGDENYVTDLFAPHHVEFSYTRESLPVSFESPAAFEAFVFTNSGPMIAARAALEQSGRWPEAYDALQHAIADSNEASDGTYRTTWEYLVAVGVRR